MNQIPKTRQGKIDKIIRQGIAIYPEEYQTTLKEVKEQRSKLKDDKYATFTHKADLMNKSRATFLFPPHLFAVLRFPEGEEGEELGTKDYAYIAKHYPEFLIPNKY